MTGIGPALRQARRSLNKTLEEASRDTRIRPEYLRALEAETFGAVGEEVYVRSFLRSYSSYLALEPDKRLSFQSTGLIHVWIPVGGAVDVVANGHDLGKLGDRKSPFEWSFKPQDFRGTPSPNGP